MPSLNVERFRVVPGKHFALASIDPDEKGRPEDGSRASIEAGCEADVKKLKDLQAKLYAQGTQALLIILLATDTGGKDSTTRRIFSGVNPQGCNVWSFGVPSAEELDHDFLWRIHRRAPRKGMIGIFNRSHYEDVTVQPIKGYISADKVPERYRHIRNFEELLIDSGVTIRKFHLAISRDEQKERLQDRLDDPTKHWKFDPADLEDRKHWDDFQAAFEDTINATTTTEAPWYVVPANRKWFRDAVVARVVVEALEQMDPQYPPPVPNLGDFRVT